MSKTAPAKRTQGMNWIRKEKRLAIYLRDGLACGYCGQSIEDGAKLTLDGERVLAGYNTMMAEIVDVAERHLQALLSASPLAHEAEMPLETGGSQGPAP